MQTMVQYIYKHYHPHRLSLGLKSMVQVNAQLETMVECRHHCYLQVFDHQIELVPIDPSGQLLVLARSMLHMEMVECLGLFKNSLNPSFSYAHLALQSLHHSPAHGPQQNSQIHCYLRHLRRHCSPNCLERTGHECKLKKRGRGRREEAKGAGGGSGDLDLDLVRVGRQGPLTQSDKSLPTSLPTSLKYFVKSLPTSFPTNYKHFVKSLPTSLNT